jgi:MinD-like ATPase involved in chromosome partitioning or flagellar assembly
MWSVLIAAAGADWESDALRMIDQDPEIVVIKRCVDVTDLLGAATTGEADVALVALDAPGLDQAAVDHLQRHRVRLVGVAPTGTGDVARAHARRIGLVEVVTDDALNSLTERLHRIDAGPAAVETAWASPDETAEESVGLSGGGGGLGAGDPVVAGERGRGTVVAVWGPAGAPGRTTMAVSLAASLAGRGVPVTLIDADPYGGSVAQQLGIVEEVSGILAASRFAAAGELDMRLAQTMRMADGIRVISGLPRPDRWTEVRPGTLAHLVELVARDSHVVIDTGFSLEDGGPGDFGTRPPRNSMTLGALETADQIVIVGTPDPVGLTRLARATVELRDLLPDADTRVVVNRMRGSLSWSQRQIADLVAGFTDAPLLVIPEDRAAADRALLAGAPLLSGPVGTAVGSLAHELFPRAAAAKPRGLGRLRRRTADTTRRR